MEGKAITTELLRSAIQVQIFYVFFSCRVLNSIMLLSAVAEFENDGQERMLP